MSSIVFKQKSIRKLKLPDQYDLDKVQIGIPVSCGEDTKVNLLNVGDVILPSDKFGATCRKNAYGYSYPDTSRPKIDRYVTTNSIPPYGNIYASPVLVDVYRKCYPQIHVPAIEIEFILYEDVHKQRFVLANLTPEVRKSYMREAINLFLEIFGFCYIYSSEIEIEEHTGRRRCNWEILPPGEKPSVHLARQLHEQSKDVNTFDIDRLRTLEKYRTEQVVEGINGFNGYYAYVFANHCILESAIYGNATYVIPKENWEVLSQKTKRELIDDKKVIEKIIHTEQWENNIRRIIQKLEKQ